MTSWCQCHAAPLYISKSYLFHNTSVTHYQLSIIAYCLLLSVGLYNSKEYFLAIRWNFLPNSSDYQVFVAQWWVWIVRIHIWLCSHLAQPYLAWELMFLSTFSRFSLMHIYEMVALCYFCQIILCLPTKRATGGIQAVLTLRIITPMICGRNK